MSLAAIAITGTFLGAGASAFGAMENADATRDAANKNAQNAYETNKLNERLFHESRGSQGFAFLPEYAKDPSGNAIEPLLMKDTLATYDAYNRLTPAQRRQLYSDAISKFSAAQSGADATAAGIFNGDLVDEALKISQPVQQARMDLALSKKSAGIEALQKTLNNIKALQAKRGFTGDSFGSRMLEAGVRREINTRGAEDIGLAKLTNEQSTADIKSGGMQMRVANLSLPYTMARRAAETLDLPENLALDQNNRRLQAFAPFRIGTQAFQYQPMPTVQPVASTGQILGQAGAQLAGGLGNIAASKYLADQNLQNNLKMIDAMKGTGALTAPPIGYG